VARGLGRTGEGVPRHGDVGGEVPGEFGVGLEGGQGGGFKSSSVSGICGCRVF
jgi:hypothetical protein